MMPASAENLPRSWWLVFLRLAGEIGFVPRHGFFLGSWAQDRVPGHLCPKIGPQGSWALGSIAWEETEGRPQGPYGPWASGRYGPRNRI